MLWGNTQDVNDKYVIENYRDDVVTEPVPERACVKPSGEEGLVFAFGDFF